MAQSLGTSKTHLRKAQAAASQFQRLCRLNHSSHEYTRQYLPPKRSASSITGNSPPSNGKSDTLRRRLVYPTSLFPSGAQVKPPTQPAAPSKAPIVPKASTQIDVSDIPIITFQSSRLRLPKPLYKPLNDPSTSYSDLFYRYDPKPPWTQTSNSFLAKLLRELKKLGSPRPTNQPSDTNSSSQAGSDQQKPRPSVSYTRSILAILKRFRPYFSLSQWIGSRSFPEVFVILLLVVLMLSWFELLPGELKVRERPGEKRRRIGDNREIDRSQELVRESTSKTLETDGPSAMQPLSQPVEPSKQVESLAAILEPATGGTSIAPLTPLEQGLSQPKEPAEREAVPPRPISAPSVGDTYQNEERGEAPNNSPNSWTTWFKFW